MNHTAIALRTKQGFIQRKSIESDCLNTFNLLTNDLLFDEVERLLPHHRERLFPPTETHAMFVAQAMSADRSCQHIVNQAANQRVVTGLTTCSTQTGGYCKARQRLPTAMVRDLTRFVGHQIDHQVREKLRWRGRKVRLVKGRDEQTLLRFIEQTLDKGDILHGDAFFPMFFHLASMQRRGVDILMEQLGARKRSSDVRKGIKLGQRDHLIALEKPKKKPYWMSEVSYGYECAQLQDAGDGAEGNLGPSGGL